MWVKDETFGGFRRGEPFPVTAVGSGEMKTVLELLCFCNRICHKMRRDLRWLGWH